MRFLRKAALALLVVAPFMAACGGGGETGGMPADSVALAAALLTPETFDTISWPSDSAALARGAVVWSYSCQKCHGNWGDGDGGFVQRGETLRPPSFRAADWRLAGDYEGMRRQVFTGTAEGMPHWGMTALRPRDIDAVTIYVQKALRP
jgi:mono/diheme cytochrome c family protein